MTEQQPPQELPPLTLGQKIKYSSVAIIFLLIVGGLIFWNVSANNKETAKVNDLKTSGIRVTGTANGDAYSYTERSRRGGGTTKYKAIYDYTFTNENRNGRQDEATAIGEKVYDTEAEVEALKGSTADVYYDPNDAGKGTYVDDEK